MFDRYGRHHRPAVVGVLRVVRVQTLGGAVVGVVRVFAGIHLALPRPVPAVRRRHEVVNVPRRTRRGPVLLLYHWELVVSRVPDA